MGKALRVLVVEDSEADALLLLRELRSGGYDVTHRRVVSESAMAEALSAGEWDVVISDHSMPQFSAPAALRVLKESGIDLPFIIVSGAIGEDLAVEAMRAGAHDFLTKGRLARLVPAVERELVEWEVRRARRAAEEELRKLNAELERRVVERTAELERANGRLAAIAQVTDVALAHLAQDDMLAEMLLRVRKILGTDMTMVLLMTEDRQKLVVRASSGLEPEIGQGASVPVGLGVAGRIAASGECLIVEDLSTEEVASPAAIERLRSLIGAPLCVGERVIGVLLAGTVERRHFSEDDLRLIEVMSDRAASIIQRARVEEERERLLAAEHEARMQAEKAVRVRDEFISVAAHELRTPVTSVLGYAQALSRQLADGESLDPVRLSRAIKAFRSQGMRLAGLAEGLLGLSELESSTLRPAMRETEVAPLAENSVSAMRLIHPQRNIALSVRESASARVDPRMLEWILASLIDNAVKFSPRRSAVEVTVETEGGRNIVIAVRDHGAGVPESESERIFDRFHKAHPDRHYGGMGIGLYVARSMAEAHGGTLTVEQPEGGGSCFVLRIPCLP